MIFPPFQIVNTGEGILTTSSISRMESTMTKKKEYNFSSLENRECNGNLYFSNIIFLEIRERKHDCNSHRDANPPRLNFNKQYPTMNACSVDNSVNGVRNVE